MDQHMLEAEKLSNDAGMAHRVHEWQMKLEPKLQEEVHKPAPSPQSPSSILLWWCLDVRMSVRELQEERKPFDIDEYGDDMLKRLDEARGDAEENTVRTRALAMGLWGLIWCGGGQEKPFESIMCKPDDTRFDICRMFLATLQVRSPSPLPPWLVHRQRG